jgi:hypothetical protein
MFWLIENTNEIDIFSQIQYEEAYIEIIPSSPTLHPVENNVSTVYIRPISSTKGHMVPINHSEAFHVDFNLVQQLINSIKKVYVIDKKEFLHYFFHKNVISLNLINKSFTPQTSPVHSFFQSKYPNYPNLNEIIPIVKHYEVCEDNFQKLQPYFSSPVNPFYNNKTTIVFNSIERNGIKINPNIFNEYFSSTNSEYIYTKYNLSTLTTRPANSFNGINFAALKKDTGERQSFIPRNDYFIEIDISAYHPTLLANLLGYTLPDEDFHEHFAKIYNVDYNTSKEITFRQIYGGIQDEYKHIDFFQKIDEYVKELWNTFKTTGKITCPISNHVFEKDKLEDMYPQKLLNYHNQNLETAQNILILWDILKLLRGKNTKLVLYVYDSFLFDVDKTEKETFKQITNIFKKYNLQIKFKKGINYNFQ